MFNHNLRFVPLSDVLTGAEVYLPMLTSIPDTDNSSCFLNIRKFKLISRNSKYADLRDLKTGNYEVFNVAFMVLVGYWEICPSVLK